MQVEVDPHERVVWYFMRPTTRPCATVGLMRDIAHMQETIRTLFDTFTDPANPPVRYTVLGSRMPGIFNLGATSRCPPARSARRTARR